MVRAEARLAGADDGLGAAGDPELGEDPRDVVAHGVGAEEKAGGDAGVVVAAGDEVEDLALAGGKLGEGLSGVGGRLAQEPRESARYLRPEAGLAPGDGGSLPPRMGRRP